MALEAKKDEQTVARLAERFDLHRHQIIKRMMQLLGQSADVLGGDETNKPLVDVKVPNTKIGRLTL